MSLYAVRPLVFACLLFLACTTAALAQTVQPIVRGVVVDATGRPIPRALVRVVEPGGATVFTDDRGRFAVRGGANEDCAVEATLTGFLPARSSCTAAGSEQDLRLELAIAPLSDALLVSATRTEAPAGQLGASVTVFSEADIVRRQMPLVSELLRTSPGAMVVTSGAPGSLTSLFVRGGESDYNKVLIDGVPVNEPGGAFFLNNLTTENIERVEVLRGAYSALFGSDAMASVIQLFTRRGRSTGGRPRGSVQIDGGTHGTLHANAAASGAVGALDYSVGVAQLQSDNRVPNNRLENTTLSAHAGVSLPGDAALRVVARGEMEDVGTPGPTAFGRPDLDASFGRNDHVVGVTYEGRRTGAFRHRASYSHAGSGQTSTNLSLDAPFVASFRGRSGLYTSSDFLYDSDTSLGRHHASYQGDWQVAQHSRWGDQRLTALVDWDGERASLQDRLGEASSEHSRNNAGFSLQQQMLWPRLFVTVGARVERNGNFGTAFVPRGAAVVVVRDGADFPGDTRVKVSAGAGIKEPTMVESFSASPYFRGNSELAPERSRSVEAGIEQRFGDRARVDLTWFDNEFRNIISLRTDPVTFEGQFFNVGVTRARGIEIGGAAVPMAPLTLRASYTFLDSEIVRSTDPFNPLFAVGQWAFRRPRHSGTFGATVTIDRVTADVSGVFIGRFVDNDFGLFDPPFQMNPGYATWDARMSVRLTSLLTGLLTVDNLADREYSAPVGYQPLGRVVRAGVRVGF